MRENGFADKPDAGMEQGVPPCVCPFARSFRALLKIRNMLKIVSFVQVGVDEFKMVFDYTTFCQGAVKRGFARPIRSSQKMENGRTQ